MDVSPVLAFGLTAVLAPLCAVVLRRRNVLDQPNIRSSHTVPVPRGAGIAVAVGALAGLAAGDDLIGRAATGLAVTSTLFALLGLAEDLLGVAPLRRLALQVAIAAIALPFLLDGMTG